MRMSKSKTVIFFILIVLIIYISLKLFYTPSLSPIGSDITVRQMVKDLKFVKVGGLKVKKVDFDVENGLLNIDIGVKSGVPKTPNEIKQTIKVWQYLHQRKPAYPVNVVKSSLTYSFGIDAPLPLEISRKDFEEIYSKLDKEGLSEDEIVERIVLSWIDKYPGYLNYLKTMNVEGVTLFGIEGDGRSSDNVNRNIPLNTISVPLYYKQKYLWEEDEVLFSDLDTPYEIDQAMKLWLFYYPKQSYFPVENIETFFFSQYTGIEGSHFSYSIDRMKYVNIDNKEFGSVFTAVYKEDLIEEELIEQLTEEWLNRHPEYVRWWE